MLKNKLIVAIGLTTLVAASSGCATVLKGKSTKVSLTSEPSGADVFVNGKQVGTSPLEISMSNKRNHIVIFRSGGQEGECRINTSASMGWVVADFFLTTPLGMIVDWGTKNWNQLDKKACHVTLGGAATEVAAQ